MLDHSTYVHNRNIKVDAAVRLVKSSKLQVNFTVYIMIPVMYSNCYSSDMAKCHLLQKCDNLGWMDNLKTMFICYL